MILFTVVCKNKKKEKENMATLVAHDSCLFTTVAMVPFGQKYHFFLKTKIYQKSIQDTERGVESFTQCKRTTACLNLLFRYKETLL